MNFKLLTLREGNVFTHIYLSVLKDIPLPYLTGTNIILLECFLVLNCNNYSQRRILC